MIKCRFAPSPTGEMHIGNLRTAIFNWIFARQNGGKFFIRIEDTDKSRSKNELVELIFSILKRMNLDFDPYLEDIPGCIDGIVTQSLRTERYQYCANQILPLGHGFFCQCDESCEICECKSKNFTYGAVRYKIPDTETLEFNDMVFGNLSIQSNTLDNFAILRADGSPTYMLAVVVDDIDMATSHIIRGEDHKTNTFKQILIYRSLGASPPAFAHLPMIVGKDRKKLSKRNGETSVKYYLEQGFVPDAIFNILLKLGWGSGNEEIIDRKKILEIFKFSDVKKSPAGFDLDKMKSFSGKYLKKFDYSEQLNEFIFNNFKKSSPYINDLYPEIVKRSDTFLECYDQIKFLWDGGDQNIKIQEDILSLLKNIDCWERQNIFSILKEYCEQQNLEIKAITKELRLKITGKEFSPDLFLILETIGKTNSIDRLSDNMCSF